MEQASAVAHSTLRHHFSSCKHITTATMDLITQGYGSSSSDSEDASSQKPAKIAKTSSLQVNVAPDVSLEVKDSELTTADDS